MYMEAYGSVGNYADTIIKRSFETAFAKDALSKQGVSPEGAEGGGDATPDTETQIADLNKEITARDKAIKSLNNKIANWRAKAEYRNSLIKMQEKELNKFRQKEMVGVK